jgi:hypothetical protein
MEVKTLFFYLIVAIAIAALIIAIIALINANTANDNANTANSSLVNYTTLPRGTVSSQSTTVTSAFSTIYSIPISTTNWKYNGYNMGILGNITVPIQSFIVDNPALSSSIVFITYVSINGGDKVAVGASEEISNPVATTVGYTVNISGELGKVNSGDNVVLTIEAATTNGTATVNAVPENSASAVYGPLN